MTKVKIPEEISKEKLLDKVEKSSDEYIEFCGIKHDDKYLILGAGIGTCSIPTVVDELGLKNYSYFHSHPVDSNPSPIDIESTQTVCEDMELVTPSKIYVMEPNCSENVIDMKVMKN